ncbi:MAG: DNA repair protein RadA [Acidimicrobiales bacterium]
MARSRTVHRCSECGGSTPRWAGRCPSCGSWSTLVEELVERPGSGGRATEFGRPAVNPVELTELESGAADPVPTDIEELDRVLGGGLVPGSVTLLGGEPGVGKSTLLLQVVGAMAAAGARCLLVSAEESGAQVRRRAERLLAARRGVWLVTETGLDGIRAAVERIAPDVVVVDSIQTVWDPALESAPGSVAQVRGCAHELAVLAREGNRALVLVGHVTKDGALAGPRVLEHLVDTVLTFEGDRHHALRMLRAVKHRFGPTGELGLFEMTDAGMQGLPDASGVFLGDRRHGSPGSVVFPAVEGYRPLLVEIQALAVSSPLVAPRRSVSGLDQGRLGLLLAVLDQRAGIGTGKHDVYLSAVGGVRVTEPGVDLAVCLAVASACRALPVPQDVVVVGEVGLGGEVRQVAHTERRLAEAARLGFRRAVVPQSAPADLPLPAIRVGALRAAVDQVLGAPALGAPVLGAPVLGAPVLGAPALGAPVLGAPVLGALADTPGIASAPPTLHLVPRAPGEPAGTPRAPAGPP